jgi:hypothetical protein
MRLALPLILLLSFGSAASATTPRWNPRAPENSQLLTAFSYATVEPVLSAIGARHQRIGNDAGRPTLSVTFANGHRAVIVMTSCDAQGASCRALTLQSVWPAASSGPAQQTAVQQFNQRYSFGKAFIAANGRPVLQRYITADYGFVRGNLAVNMLAFATQTQRFTTEVVQRLEPRSR